MTTPSSRGPTPAAAREAAMLFAADVHYGAIRVGTACIGFADWPDASAILELTSASTTRPSPYEPGAFYRRELPFLLELLQRARQVHPLEGVVVDGHVWLGPGKPGLGARLHEALGGAVAVIGVAKSQFLGAPGLAVQRGTSRKPLFVTAVGMDPSVAAAHVSAMHGRYRVPTLLRRVDRLARDAS